MARVDELRERLGVVHGAAKQLEKKAEDEQRDLTVEEAAELDSLLGQFDRLKSDVERLEKLGKQTEEFYAGTGRKTEADRPRVMEDDPVEEGQGKVSLSPRPGPGKDPRERVPAQLAASHPKNWNFRSMGDFALSVKRACLNRGSPWEDRLVLSERLASVSTWGSEGVGSEGGFAVPPDFRTQVMEMVLGEASLAGMCDQITVSGNSFSAPIDMTTPWQTTGGVQAYWGSEGGTKSQSKPLLEEINVKLNKVYALVPMTDELLEDATAMDGYLRRKAPQKIAYKVTEAILQGNGVGKPLGLLNSPALVSVAKETSQVADTLIARNIIKMYSRLYAPERSGAIWVINQDVEPYLQQLSLPGLDNDGNASANWGSHVYLPANGLSGSPYATLYGRPVIPTQACETLGDQGDIFFFNPKQYLLLLKGGTNPKVDVSMHLWFDQDLTAFRFVLRVGGMPWWSGPISARDGSATYSPYVTLDAR